MSNARITNGPMQLIPNGTVAMRYVTVSSSSVNVINTTPLDTYTSHVWVTVTGANIRITTDGSNPTASQGHQITAGSTMIWSAAMARAVKAIREGGVDATLTISGLTAI